MNDPSEASTKSDVVLDLATNVTRVIAVWDGGSARCELGEGAVVAIGRSRECDLAIDLASVSRKHARVHAGPPIRIEDLGSSNGTRVNGERLAPNAELVIRAGDVIQIGKAMVVVQRALGAVPESRRSAPPRDPMARIRELIELVATSDLSVILQGETGVGKEIAAASIHAASRRAMRPLTTINCAALPEALLESELFGHEKGAFTSATQRKHGRLETGDGGTVFLDEVDALPLVTQAKILRTVEAREVLRVGSVEPKLIDVRFIAASNRDLALLARSGDFRADLYFRLNGITLDIPPLRERALEIRSLAVEFAAGMAQKLGRGTPELSNDVIAALEHYDWPGNIRELRNAVEQAVLRAVDGCVGIDHLPSEVVDGPRRADGVERPAASAVSRPPAPAPALEPTVEELRVEMRAADRRRVMDALARAGGNQTRAAKILGISRRTLLHRLDEYDLPRPRKPDDEDR